MAICFMPKPEQLRKLNNQDFQYLNSRQSLQLKILAIEEILALTNEEIRERKKIVADITKTLKNYYPDCAIKVYGSSANGFGFKGCDLDLLFLPFPEYCNLDFKGKGNGIVPSPCDVLKDSKSKEHLLLMEEEMHLKFVQRIMHTNKDYFKRTIFIPAKCPILNVFFRKSSIPCDFSASNRLVEYNTELLWLFGKLDRRVRPLVMLLRYWAKSLGFIKKSLLSSYALTLMVIFYLQNTQPPVLPSVKYLNELSEYSRIVDGWQTAICVEPEYVNSFMYNNTATIEQLLVEFFEFYWEFDFLQNVVSPHLGKALSVKDLKEWNDERVKSFQVTLLSIQDPFHLSRNISRNGTMKTPFKVASLIAKKLFLQKNFPFQLLFDGSYYEQEMKTMFAPTIERLPSVSVFFSLQLNYEWCCNLGVTTQLNPWFEKVCQTVIDVMQFGLLVECEVVDKILWNNGTLPPPAKRRKVSVDGVGDLKFIMSIQCVMYFPTLLHRKKVNLHDLAEDKMNEDELPSNLIKEYKISKELTKDKLETLQNTPPFLRFMCNLLHYPSMQIPDIIVGFSPLADSDYDKNMIYLLRSFVEKHTKKILEIR